MKDQIVIEHVDKFYGKKKALSDVTMTIETGMFGLLGRNGAGKTTLMKLLATLHCKDAGKITVCGESIENSARIRELIGFLPQDFNMYPNMSVYEAMDYLGMLSGIDGASRKKRIPFLLEKVNLLEEQKKKVKNLSGGMKRRLGIAQALIHEPRVLIVDEPTAGLDPEERIRFRNLLCEVAEDRIVILSTHIASDIEATCENIAILNEGKILWKGSLTEMLKEADGRVYLAEVSDEELRKIKKEYTVTSVQKNAGRNMVRFISMASLEGGPAEQVKPNCEDAYMYCLQKYASEEGGKRNAES
ncbi:MAG: ABC transporter ATP-binding protein [Acetatifactor sp.]